MDATESAALRQLGERDVWGVDELPRGVDTDILRCLDSDGLIEARYVVMRDQQRFPGDDTPSLPSPSVWFSPIEEPTMAGDWHAITSKRVRDDRDHPCEVRLTDRGRAALSRLDREKPEAGSEPTSRASAIENPSERLRQFGIDCATMIAQQPEQWDDAVAWFRALPKCWAITQIHRMAERPDDPRTPWLTVDLGDTPVKRGDEPGHVFDVYDVEAEMNRIRGSHLRRLVTAWDAATFRFLHHDRGDESLRDFGLDDARRVSLLAALSLNRDFDGTVVGLSVPWDHPNGCGASFEGRYCAWDFVPGGRYVAIVEAAVGYLQRMVPIRQPQGADSPSAPDTNWREIQQRLMARYDRGDPYTSVRELAEQLGCSVATIQKAIRPPHSALDRLDEPERAAARSAAYKLAGWQGRGKESKRSPRATSLTGMVADRAAQTREQDPADQAEVGDVDSVFARLLAESKPEERARLNSLRPAQQRKLVALMQKDPDKYQRVLDRRP